MNSGPAASARRILVAANGAWNLVNFRAPIIARLRREGYSVLAAVPKDEAQETLGGMVSEVYTVPMDARGLSPLQDTRLLVSYYRLLRHLRPSVFLAFTAKPNIYGSVAATWLNIPVINTITGLGTGFLSGRALQNMVAGLYRYGLQHSHRVFFHNPDDRKLFVDRRLVRDSQALVVPGSGVDIERFSPNPDRAPPGTFTFLFIGRLLKDKGALEFAEAAALVKKEISARFQMLGEMEDHPKAVSPKAIQPFVSDGTVEMLGSTPDVRPFIVDADCVVLPSYREGLPRVVLEASAMAKPVIVSDVPGCRHAVDHGVTGLLCEPRSAASLAETMLRIAGMSPRQHAQMGEHGRAKVEQEFSQERVVEAYLAALKEIGV